MDAQPCIYNCNIKLEQKLHKMKQTYPHLDTILRQYYSLPLSLYLNKKSFVGLRSLPFEVVYLHIADVTSISVIYTSIFTLKTYFFYFTLPFLQNTHINLSILSPRLFK